MKNKISQKEINNKVADLLVLASETIKQQSNLIGKIIDIQRKQTKLIEEIIIKLQMLNKPLFLINERGWIKQCSVGDKDAIDPNLIQQEQIKTNLTCPNCKEKELSGTYNFTTPADINFKCSNCDFYKHTDETTSSVLPKDEIAIKLRKQFGQIGIIIGNNEK